QETLPVSSTVVPILLGSDQIYLTNYSGSKKLWPIYLTIRNICSIIYNSLSMHTWTVLTLLPVSLKCIDSLLEYLIQEQEKQSFQMIYDVISYVLSPLVDIPSLERIEMVYANENIRHCYPAFVAGLEITWNLQ
ncbi:hypothetical protein BDZ91DRAFT_671644, partial [Kalaharituber pfeilii]